MFKFLKEGGVHVLGAPVIQSDGNLTAIIELYRFATELAEWWPLEVDNRLIATDFLMVCRRENKDENGLGGQFHEEDEEIVSSYLVWGGIALHYADMYHALNKQRNLHQFLLTVVKSIFQVTITNGRREGIPLWSRR